MNSYRDVTIVLISYKSEKKVLNFLKKISSKYKIIIIENSKDKNLKFKIKKKKNIKLHFKKNIGYGRAINFARSKIKTKYIFVFNPDVKIETKNLVNNFYKIAEKFKNKFLMLGPSYTFEKKQKEKIVKKKTISGASMFINCEVFDHIGGFDENIFLYFEENDLCKRGNLKKYYSYMINTQRVSHNIGSSVDTKNLQEKENLKKLTLWHFIWSKYYYFQKHYGSLISLIIFTPTMIRIIYRLFLYKIKNDKKSYLKYYMRYSGLKTSILKKKSNMRIII